MNKEFTIKDLRTGNIVVTKGVGNGIVIGNRIKYSSMLFTYEALAPLKDYNEDLIDKDGFNKFDIEEVYEIIDGYNFTLPELINGLPKDKVKLIWKREREIDWNKVPKFTRVQVRDKDDREWKNRRFIKYTKDSECPYKTTTCDEFTFEHSYIGWKQIRIYDKSEIKEEWYK